MLHLFYNRNHTLNRLFLILLELFPGRFNANCRKPVFVVISMLALESFRSIRFAWIHIILKFTDKSLNPFYYTLAYAAFEHYRWIAVTARLALGCVPPSLRHYTVFLSIDDTMVEKYSMKFQARSKLFDHAAHNGFCISYAAVRLLPYYNGEFQNYQGQSPQEINQIFLNPKSP